MKNTSPDKLIRLNKLQTALKNLELDALLVEDSLDLFYLTGLKLSVGKLLISSKDCVLFVDGRYLQIATEKAPCQSFLDSTDQFLGFCSQRAIKKVGFDGRHTSYDQFVKWEHLYSALTFVSAGKFFKTIRAVKDEEEIAKMKKSAALLWRGFEHINTLLKVGITEKEVAKSFEIFCLQNGADGLSFESIIAFGSNGSMPHYRSQNVPLKEGDAVLIDIGVVLDSYHSDMTRVVFFKKEDPYLAKLYAIAKRAQKAALAFCLPGSTFKQLDLAAREVMKQEGVEELFVHSLGHGIGLETHEYPRIKYDNEDKDVVLESGMVFTVEPGLYVPGVGGVRYEDTVVVTANGYENFYPEH